MTTRSIFRNIWRANAVIIFAAGLIALLVLVIGAFGILRKIYRDPDGATVASADDGPEVRERLSLGFAMQIDGHDLQLIPLESDQSGVYFSRSGGVTRNYGFVSPSAPTRWLYDHNRFLIFDVDELSDGESDAESDGGPTALISFTVVQKDSDGDGRLTDRDLFSLLLTKPDGTGGVVVLEGVKRVLSQDIVGAEVFVVHEDASGYAASVFALSDFSAIRREKLLLPTGNSSM